MEQSNREQNTRPNRERRNDRRPRGEKPIPEFKEKLVYINRVAKVV